MRRRLLLVPASLVAAFVTLASCDSDRGTPHTKSSNLFTPPGGGYSVRLPKGCRLADSTADTMENGLMARRYIFRNGLMGAVSVEHAPLPDEMTDSVTTGSLLNIMTEMLFQEMDIVRKDSTSIQGHPAQTVYFTADMDGDTAAGRSAVILAEGNMYHLTYVIIDEKNAMNDLEAGEAEAFFDSFLLLKATPTGR